MVIVLKSSDGKRAESSKPPQLQGQELVLWVGNVWIFCNFVCVFDCNCYLLTLKTISDSLYLDE
jgi:hypothetical protein